MTAAPPDYWPQIISGLFALGGVLIGGIVTAGVTLFSTSLGRRNERRAVAAAIAAELTAYIALMDRRDQLGYIEGIAKMNEAAIATGGTAILPQNWITEYEQSRDIFPVLTAALPKIGILGAVCRDVAEYYTLVQGIRTTIIAVGEGNFAHSTPADVVRLIRSEIALWRDATTVGRRAIDALNDIAGRV